MITTQWWIGSKASSRRKGATESEQFCSLDFHAVAVNVTICTVAVPWKTKLLASATGETTK